MNFTDLVRDHHARVYRVARGIVRDAATAEDVTQDVFLDLLRRPGAATGAEDSAAFLGRCAVNRALKALRSGGRRERHEAMAPERSAEMDPVEAAFRSELRDKVGDLPEDQRVAVSLHYFGGHTVAETAALLEVPPGTVASRLGSALDRLRKALASAAFVLLLARLESELSAVGAEEPPPGLERRLQNLESGLPPQVETPRTSRRLAGAAAIVAALFLALFLAGPWRRGRDSRESVSGSAHNEAGATGESGSQGGASRDPSGSATADSGNGTTLLPPDAVTITCEGFLTRHKVGLGLTEKCLGERQDIDGFHFDDEMAFAGLPLVIPRWDWGDILKKKGECVYVRVRVVLIPDEGQKRTARMRVERLLLREEIRTSWIEPATRLEAATDALKDADRLEPGVAKRTALLNASAAIVDAWHAARAARAGDANAFVRPFIETTWVGTARVILEAYGLDADFRGVADGSSLASLFHKCPDGAVFRKRVLQGWGEVALQHPFYVFPGGRGNRGMEDGQVTTAEAISQLEPAEFAALRESDAKADPEMPRDATDAYRLLARALRAAFDKGLSTMLDPEKAAARESRALEVAVAAGWDIAELEAAERAAFVLDGGVRVASVVQGGCAEAGGVRAGDLIWRLDSPATAKEEATERFVRDIDSFREILLDAVEAGNVTVTLRLLREGQPATAELRVTAVGPPR